MALEMVGSGEINSALLLVKVVLALLAVFIFLYYKFSWDRAKKHLQIHFFFTKWRAVRHAIVLGIAAVGFAAGFSIELFGASLGLTPNMGRFVSNIFEIGSLFSMLYVFFSLALEDVPHFQHIADAAHHRHHTQQPPVLVQKPVPAQPAPIRPVKKAAKKKKGKKKR
jgi:hypothetical protein